MFRKFVNGLIYAAGYVVLRFTKYFDAVWYELSYPGVTKFTAIHHYLVKGGNLDYSPSRSFNARDYRSKYLRDSGVKNPLLHYLFIGRFKGYKASPSPPSNADIIRLSGLLDDQWYYAMYEDVRASGIPALRHYLSHGWQERRSPGPNFNSDWYLRRYPDIEGTNPLLHFLFYGKAEGRDQLPPEVNFDIAIDVLVQIQELDPELLSSNYTADIKEVEVYRSIQKNKISSCFENIMSNLRTTPQALIFIPALEKGGANLLAQHLSRAYADVSGSTSVLTVVTDSCKNFEQAVSVYGHNIVFLADSRFSLSQTERGSLVELLVRSIAPRSVININSAACWRAIREKGQRMARSSKLYAMLFCEDFDSQGVACGYADRFLRQCLPSMAAIYFDNQTYISKLVSEYGIPPSLSEKLVLLRQPSPQIRRATSALRQQHRRLQVLWAGRLVRQKNLSLLSRIIQNAPQYDFHIWGEASDVDILNGFTAETSRCSTNTFIHGGFKTFNEIETDDIDVFLYTSLWDGLPNVILEAAAAGLPVVASDVGGIGELVTTETGWLINSTVNPDPYIAALDSISVDRDNCEKRVLAMQQKLRCDHNWDKYTETLKSCPKNPGGALW